jgi:hypothetical protein
MDELLATGGRTVPAEWIDYNGHMMDAYVSDGHVTPMPPAAVRAVTALTARQAPLPRPGQAGRRVAIPARHPG